MKDLSVSQGLVLPILLSVTFLLTGCTFTTNFVIVNASTDAIRIRYTVKTNQTDSRPAKLMLPITPALKRSSDLGKQVPWSDLSASQYAVDVENRTVTVSLNPRDALRIEHRNLVYGPQDEYHRAANFGIEDILITGTQGDIHLIGEQAR